ncbi:emerin (Emery-Dreifuss muscular dystrophy) [Pseudoliparis swirei]|uniref:emerin (Emery-Dreifuss muscular dystrophy) n=1 Tax=Pseudoliparis swirei TaxID=2059687 RepID=UPI0024BE1E5D|nr:emerin (Emery-Dreifuss muscular dystrophy) [Pseudoliparis swirei]
MSSLRSKSAEDISELLDEYGIKHGPVVDSTRGLYERKLKEAMAKGKPSKPSSDKTYYREEEEVTYEYRTPVSSEAAGDRQYSTYSRSKPAYRGQECVDEPRMYDTPSTLRNSFVNSTPMDSPDAPKAPKSSRLVPLWVQFVFFLAVAVFLYLVFSSMETNKSLKGLE